MRDDIGKFESDAITKSQILKVTAAIIIFLLLLAASLILYPARFHLKNKFLAAPLGSYTCNIYDEGGSKLAEGRFSIARRAGTTIDGDWQFRPATEAKRNPKEWHYIDDRLHKLIGEMKFSDVEINLNPNIDDSNDILKGKIVGGAVRGDFMFCGFAGCVKRGSFEAIRE